MNMCRFFLLVNALRQRANRTKTLRSRLCSDKVAHAFNIATALCEGIDQGKQEALQ